MQLCKAPKLDGPGQEPGCSLVGIAMEMVAMVAEEAMIRAAIYTKRGTMGLHGGQGGGDQDYFKQIGSGKMNSRGDHRHDLQRCHISLSPEVLKQFFSYTQCDSHLI